MPTIGDVFAAARTILNDVSSTAGPTRYTDGDLMTAFNLGMTEARARRPDAFLDMGMRNALPTFKTPDDDGTDFPLDIMFFSLFVYFVAGWSELREDEFASNTEATAFLNRFSTGLIMLVNQQAAQTG